MYLGNIHFLLKNIEKEGIVVGLSGSLDKNQDAL